MKIHRKMTLVAGALAAACSSAALAVPVVDEAGLQVQGAPGREELSLAALEDRLRDTRAISPLKKLSLKAEIDRLLARFRIAHAGGTPTVTALRDPYDKLIARIELMLRNDPALARDIMVSKEAIWQVLADRTQFASL
jgi:hypothetical protein